MNADDPRVIRFREIHRGAVISFGLSLDADVRAEEIAYEPDGTRFRVAGVDFHTALAGRHAVLNLLAALAVARAFDILFESLRDAVRSFAVGTMRGERLEHEGIIVWNDCYNSNPEAVHAMLEVLRATPARRHIAVLGEMLELGAATEPLHRQAGLWAAESGLDMLIGVHGGARWIVEEAVRAGMPPEAAHFFEDPTEAGAFLRPLAGEGDAILFWRLRGVKIERAMEKVLA